MIRLLVMIYRFFVKAGEAEKRVEGDEGEGAELFPKGNPLNWARGGVTALVACVMLFLLMAHNGQMRFGVPLGIVLAAVAAWGVMDIVGTFDDARNDDVVAEVTLARMGVPVAGLVVAIVLFGLALAGGQSGVGKQWQWGVLVTATFIGLVLAIYDLGRRLGPWAVDETGQPRALWHRHGFWLMVIAGLLYLPALGSYSLWDPWETHYGEVAREVLARDDWISLWWAQDGWFWSKPILNFWMQAIAMASLGTHYQPDQMLIGADGAPIAHPEWVVRAPNFLLTALAMYLIYKGTAKVFGRRAGFIGTLVLATMPDWFFLAHQTMTDMPFVAPMTAAMGLLLLGLNTNPDVQVKLYELRAGALKFRLSAWHLVFGAILICAIPQILYLISRNLELVVHGSGSHGFRAHWDEFRSGSGMGNCGLPGNEACALTNPASIPKGIAVHPEGFGDVLKRLFLGFEPVVQGVVWGAVLSGLLYMNWGERRRQRLYYLAAWFFAAIATMGKGPAGFALPMICGFAYVGTTRRWGELLRFEMVSGLLIILTVAIPWFVAMYVRHGSPFTDRLIFHDMFNRAFHHVHDTNEGDDTSFRFYVWQLGYALFPWTGLAPLGLMYWLRKSDTGERLGRMLGLSGAAASVPAVDMSVGAPATEVVEDELGELKVKAVKQTAAPEAGSDASKGDASLFFVMWFVFAFALFSFMGTKFHHYIFPAVPPVAMLIGVVLDDMLEGKVFARGLGWVKWAVGAAGLSMVGVEIAVLVMHAIAPMTGGSLSGFWGGHIDAPTTPMDPTKEVDFSKWTTAIVKSAEQFATQDRWVIVAGAVLFGLAFALHYGLPNVFAPAAPKSSGASAKKKAAKSAYRGEGVTDKKAEAEDEDADVAEPLDPERAHERLMVGAAALASVVVLGLVTRDLAAKPEGADQPGAIRLLHLFTYNYRRAWPESLDFGAVLGAFGIVAIVIALLLVVHRIRRFAVVGMLSFAFVWALWGLDVYMVRTAPHWGQHEVMQAYYANRASADEPIIAYQMNWKGENFYTGNKIPAYVSSGANFTSWVKAQKDKGVKVMFFVTEHSRTGGLKSEAGAKSYREITDKELCNKFVLVRAEL